MYVHRHSIEIKIRKYGFNPQRMYIGIPMLPYFFGGLGLYAHDNNIKFSLAQELLELNARLRIGMATEIYVQLRDLKEKNIISFLIQEMLMQQDSGKKTKEYNENLDVNRVELV